ncbi:MAG: hypothetical protein IPO81_20210 [Kouleothrix sp.]|nr:hypothetical protein [Kouleothrix sp.]
MSTALAAVLMLGIVLGLNLRATDAANANVGYLGPSFTSAAGTDVTASKPQSKLWYNDGLWWAVMFSKSANNYHIYRLNWPDQWVDTGTAVDDRPLARADVLWDSSGAVKYLYVVSTLSNLNTSATNEGRLYRYTYSTSTKTYTLGSPYVVVMKGSTETLTLDKDSTGRFWVAFTQGSKVYVNNSTTDPLQWGTQAVLKGSLGVGSDDIAALVAYNDKDGPSVGVLWSSHTSTSAASYMYFARHKDTDALDAWQIEQIYGGTGTCLADDHINLKSLQSDPYGRIFAAIKTSVGDSGSCTGGTDLIRLVVRYPDNTWKWTVFGATSDQHTRPIVVLDSENSKVYMFATAPTSCGVIYMKSTSMNNPSFSSGKGTPFISSSTYTCINNATSTKQTVNSSTGLVVLASDESKLYYLHNAISLGSGSGATPTTTPTGAAAPSATATPLTNATPTATASGGATATPTSTSIPPGGTRLKDITFEGGSLTDPATGFDSVVTSASLISAGALKGSYTAQIPNTANYLREDLTSPVDELFVSFYLKLNALPGASARMALITNGTASAGNLYLNTNGTLQLKNGSTAIGSSAALTPGTLYRVGLHQKKGSGSNAVVEAYLATGDAAFAGPFASSAAQNITTQASRFSLGATNSNAVNISVDDVRLDSGGMPGPSVAGGAAPTSTPTVAATATPTDVAATATPTDVAAATAATATPTEAAATATPTEAAATATPTSTTPSGGRLKDITFEGGSLTDPATGFDSVVTSVSLISAGALKGSYAAQIPNSANYLREDLTTAADELFVSFYIKVTTLPATNARLALITNGTASAGNLYLNANGTLQLRNASTAIGSSAALTPGTLYRVGLHQKKGTSTSGVLEAYLATGDAAFAGPFASSAAQNITTQASRFSLGATNGNAVDVVLDDVRLDTAAMP